MPRAHRASTRKTRSTSTARSSTAERSSSTTKTPTLDSLTNQLCANCSVGVLQVVRYDPDAQHEIGQNLEADNQNPSGGAYEVDCPYCGFHESRPLGGSNGGRGER